MINSQPLVYTKIYLINLDQDTERLSPMTQQLNRLHIAFERFPAIRGVDMPTWLRPYFLNADGSIASDLRIGEVGCYASHLAIMLRVIQDGQPALVLEDDIEIESDFTAVLSHLHLLPPNWDIVRLSNHYNRGFLSISDLSGRYRVVKFCRVPASTGAYLISPRGANKFLAWKGLRTLPVDQDLRRTWDCNMTTYGIHPRPVRPNGGPSTIATMDGRAILGRRRLNGPLEMVRDIHHSIAWLGLAAWARSIFIGKRRRIAE